MSYGKEDLAAARRISASLDRRRGIDVFFDERSLKPGERWKPRIEKEIRTSDFFILLLSTRSVSRRGFVHSEVTTALEVLDTVPPSQIYLLPLRLDDCEIPDRLSDLHILDLYPDWESSVERVLDVVLPRARKSRRANQRVWFAAHSAQFIGKPGVDYFFLEIGNRRSSPIDVTHVWYEVNNVHVDIQPPSRELPYRLAPGESWQTFIRREEVPANDEPGVFERFHLRITGGETFASIHNKDIPRRGTLPGGPVDLSEI